MSRVVLAMSGGVDSSVAAWLLKEEGHEVIGVFMRHGLAAETACAAKPARRRKQGCCSSADAADARQVADMLGLPFYVLNFEREFARIVDYFVAQYVAGRTPNPCIVCNTWLKFGKLFEYADSVGAEYVATGHYARLVKQDACLKGDSPIFVDPCATGSASATHDHRFCDGARAPAKIGTVPEIALCRGKDEMKDQSYVLFGIQRGFLGRLMFPLGDRRKEEIRRIAGSLGLGVAGKRDSQEICFIPDQDHAGFIRRHKDYADTSGEIVTADGNVVGQHGGLEQFTIGQRKGLQAAFGQPRYVIRIEADTRRIVIGTRKELARGELSAVEANWLVQEEFLSHRLSCQAKIRYRSRSYPATVEAGGRDRFRVWFDEPCYGIAPGQAVVLYQDDRVLGGGWIE